MENNFCLNNKITASKEALGILKQTVSKIKQLNTFVYDPTLLSMTAEDIANALSQKINLKELINPSKADLND